MRTPGNVLTDFCFHKASIQTSANGVFLLLKITQTPGEACLVCATQVDYRWQIGRDAYERVNHWCGWKFGLLPEPPPA
jgi:hypothetical protein